MNVNIEEFLRICIDCIIKCQQCAIYSLGRAEMETCSKLADECARLCSLSSYLVKHDENNHLKVLSLCTDICNICSEECDKFNYEFTAECSRACLKMAIFSRKFLLEERQLHVVSA